jgi:integrase
MDRYGDLPAARLTPELVKEWVEGQGWGESTRWLALTCLKAALNWSTRPPARLLTTNPLQGIAMPRLRSRGAEALITPEEHERIMAAAPEPIWRALLALRETGCRPGEVATVEARHFVPDAGVWLLDRHKTDKTGRPRIIWLTSRLVELSKELVQRHPVGPLFRRADGTPLKAKDLSDWLRRHRAKLGVPRVVPYSHRHGLVTDLLAAGVTETQVAALIGHVGTAVLHRHYNHLTARVQALHAALGRVRS